MRYTISLTITFYIKWKHYSNIQTLAKYSPFFYIRQAVEGRKSLPDYLSFCLMYTNDMIAYVNGQINHNKLTLSHIHTSILIELLSIDVVHSNLNKWIKLVPILLIKQWRFSQFNHKTIKKKNKTKVVEKQATPPNMNCKTNS